MKCIYHNDADGCAAAAVIQMAFQSEKIDFIPAQYEDDSPDCTGEKVIIVDFSYPLEILDKIKKQAVSLRLYDHHASASEMLMSVDYATFDINKSGATLVWSAFFPHIPTPLFLQYIEDRDLWKFRLPDSKEHSVGLQSYPLNVDDYAGYIEDESSVQKFKNDGKVILRYQEIQIEKVLSQPVAFCEMAGHIVPCVNHTDSFTLSEVLHRLSDGHPFSAGYFDIGQKRVYSLRSMEGGIDVKSVAMKYGGGGHKHAAGFSVKTGEMKMIFRPMDKF